MRTTKKKKNMFELPSDNLPQKPNQFCRMMMRIYFIWYVMQFCYLKWLIYSNRGYISFFFITEI